MQLPSGPNFSLFYITVNISFKKENRLILCDILRYNEAARIIHGFVFTLKVIKEFLIDIKKLYLIHVVVKQRDCAEIFSVCQNK